RAVWGATLFRKKFTPDIRHGVLLQRNAGIPALLRTVVHQSFLANVEIPRSRTAAPLIGPAVGNIVLEPVEARVMALFESLHLQEHFALFWAQRLELSLAIVNDANGRSEAELHGASPHHQCIVRVVDATTNNGIDVDVKIGVFSQQLQLLVEHLQRLLGDVIWPDVVDADLKMVEARAVQSLDAVCGEQITVGNQSRNDWIGTNMGDNVIQLGMQ